MEDVKINNISIDISSSFYNHSNCIIDMGTPFMTLPLEVFNALKQIFISNCSETNLIGICNVPSNQTLFDGYCLIIT